MNKFVYLKNVVTLQLNEDKCNGCGMCTKVCPHNVFALSDKKAHIINRDNCMECGACALNCQQEAIFVKSGVGCATGIINGILKNSDPACGCSSDSNKTICC